LREGLAAAFALNWWELLIIIAVLAPIILVLLWYSLRRDREREDRQDSEAQQRYQELVAKHHLTPADEGVVDRLSAYLNDPTRKYLLLQNQRMYHQAAALALDAGSIPDDDVSALRFKLGFVVPPQGVRPYSTTQIPEGAGVLVLMDIRPPENATVLAPEPTDFRLQLEDRAIRYSTGSEITVVYQNPSGIFRFTSDVTGHDETNLRIRHSEKLDQIQRRNHYRRSLPLPVYVKAAYREERPTQSRLVEIGGDGASLMNPSQRFHQGDDIELTFHPSSDSTLHLVANVLRTSQGNTVLHVKFGRIKETTRDQVYNLLFADTRKKQGEQADR